MPMRKRMVGLLLAVWLLGGVQPVWAGDPLTKLGRGFTNILFAVCEYGTNIQKSADEKGAASGVFEGFFRGTYYAAGRILTGLYDVVTFLIPAPEDYGPLMKPDYVFTSQAKA